MVKMDELDVNIYVAMRYIVEILSKIENTKYLLTTTVGRNLNKNELYIRYNIVNQLIDEKDGLLIEVVLDTLPKEKNYSEIYKNTFLPVFEFNSNLLKNVYQFPFLIKFCELLEELNGMNYDDVSQESWLKICEICLDYGIQLKEMELDSFYHIKKIKKNLLN